MLVQTGLRWRLPLRFERFLQLDLAAAASTAAAFLCIAQRWESIPRETVAKPFSRFGEIVWKEARSYTRINASIGGMKMIALKLIAFALAAGVVSTFASEDFGTNLVLAIFTCLS